MQSCCLAFFILVPVLAEASVKNDLQQLEHAIFLTITRLESGIDLEFSDSEKSGDKISLQYELSVLAIGQPQLLEEDYRNLAFSLINRHFGELISAKYWLQQELNVQTLRPIRNWLKKEIAELSALIKATTQPGSLQAQYKARDYRVIICELSELFTQF